MPRDAAGEGGPGREQESGAGPGWPCCRHPQTNRRGASRGARPGLYARSAPIRAASPQVSLATQGLLCLAHHTHSSSLAVSARLCLLAYLSSQMRGRPWRLLQLNFPSKGSTLTYPHAPPIIVTFLQGSGLSIMEVNSWLTLWYGNRRRRPGTDTCVQYVCWQICIIQ